jgi:hypothetical protein
LGTGQLFIASAAEGFFLLLLLYAMRLFERRLGSARFAAMLGFTLLSGCLLQLLVLTLLSDLVSAVPPGPYLAAGLSAVLYWRLVPATARYRLFWLTLTDKLPFYLILLQLVLASGPPIAALLALLPGVAAGLLYLHPALPGLRSAAVSPALLARLLPAPAPRRIPRPASQPAAALVAPIVPAAEGGQGWEEALQVLQGLGLARAAAEDLLRAHGGNGEAALNSLLDAQR